MTVPTTTVGAVLRQYGERIELSEVEIPALVDGALILEVKAATICGTDAHMRKGRLSVTSELPVLMGHEYVGEIVAVQGRSHDARGRRIGVGDRIVAAYPWCGRCYWCAIAGQPTLCKQNRMYGWGPCDVWPYASGGFARHIYIRPESQVLKVPAELDSTVVASATCALRTVMHGYERLAHVRDVQFEDTVVVLGTGPVGLYSICVARARGAARVIAIGAPAARLALASEWGADEVLDITATTAQERLDRVHELTDGLGADVVVDCAGPSEAFADALTLVRDAGTVLEIGATSPDLVPVHPPTFTSRMVTVTGNISGSIRHYDRALSFLDRFSPVFDFGKMLSEPRPLDQVNEAIDAAQAQMEIKPTIDPWL